LTGFRIYTDVPFLVIVLRSISYAVRILMEGQRYTSIATAGSLRKKIRVFPLSRGLALRESTGLHISAEPCLDAIWLSD